MRCPPERGWRMNREVSRTEFGVSRRQLVTALRRLRRGDFSVRLSEDGDDEDSEIAALFNEVVSLNQEITEEFERLSRVVGKEGKIGHRAKVRGASGGWDTNLRAVNELIDDMVQPITEVARVIGSVAKGDLSQAMAVEIEGRPLKGEFLRIGKVVNTMVEQLSSFASEVTRVAREVGTEGKLGGQARVRGVAGTWKDLTDNVNLMAANLTGQVRNIAEVTTAVASGDLVQEDHGRREGRDPGAQEHHQHDGRPAQLVRLGSDPRGARSGHRGQAWRTGAGGRRGRHLARPDRERQFDGGQPHRPGAQHRRSDDGGGVGRFVEEDHRRREGRNPRAQEHHQHDGRPAQRLRLGSDPRGARGRHRGQAWRAGAGPGRRRHLGRPYRQRQSDGRQPHRPGAQHRRSDHRRRQGRSVEEDHGRREGRDPRAQEHHQHDGRPAQLVRVRGDSRGARGRVGRQARRPGAGRGRRRDLGRPHRQRQSDGRQFDRPGAQHRRGDDRRRQGRSVEEDHGRRARRNSRAQEHHQHHGRPAQLVRLGSDPRCPRGRHRGPARRPGAGRGRRRHVEGFDRQCERHGRQSDRPGAQHRRGDHRRRPRRSVQEDHGRREGRNSRAQGHHQHDGRPAQLVRVGSHPRGARGRHRRPARRPGAGRRRRRHVEGSDRQRQRHGREPDGPGAQHRRSDDRGRVGRPFQEDHRRREGRNPRAQEHHQRDGRSAQLVRLGSHPRGARSGHRGQARRPGRRFAASAGRGRI